MLKIIEADHYSNVNMDEWPATDFSPEEMACRHCGAIKMDRDSLEKLQSFRSRMGSPFVVHSAYRCPAHNRAVGGAKRSQHMEGKAFDISMENHDPQSFIDIAKQMGFWGIGTYPKQNFVHIDNRSGGPARWGDPFQPRHSRFAPEPRPKGVARQTAEEGGVTVASAVAVHEGAKKGLNEIAPYLSNDIAWYLGLAVALIGASIVVWRIVKRYREKA